MELLQKWLDRVRKFVENRRFLDTIGRVEIWVSKILSAMMVIVILVAMIDLAIYLGQALLSGAFNFLSETLVEIFGLFLSILIALAILQNITAYLRRRVVQVELVIATSLTGLARKIIILDLKDVRGLDLIGLAIALFALSISYWIVRNTSVKQGD